MPAAKKPAGKKKAPAATKAAARKSSAPAASAKGPAAATKAAGARSPAFSAEERAAMREAVREYSAQARRKGKAPPAEQTAEVLAKIAAMTPSDRALAQKVHAIVTAVAPDIEPRTWYGMPAYARAGQTICWFQDAAKFKSRYATLGFSDKARLDEGRVWPVVYAISEITPADEARIRELVRRALG